MTASADRTPLIELMEREALQRGTFTLASGKTANYYLDCRRVTLHPKGAGLVGRAMLDFISTNAANAGIPDAVGGMAIGADPITASIVTLAGMENIELSGFMVRKEPKGHGMGQQVEGPVTAGQNVVIVEDVITSGGSAIKAVEAAQAFGLNVLYVLAIIDRLAGGEAAFAAKGLKLYTLTTIRDFGIEPESAE
ncbi:orotate phosphoribosyltransferase [Neorhodopirellula lusitana]|uniref:Orotate phosphoribosyltransferase n=1 Tax=Neorhodopirellula lusitana TaxID=445327 RepID=A0ABY1Q8K9_9BACT|nr:orotate phosphoribosyltransferase [Neorhodopirellula lusitana]SMP63126.1 orotate phosphoribosyltransferase [Neorhodopirellula lusitana]